jgi:hypothetical protein
MIPQRQPLVSDYRHFTRAKIISRRREFWEKFGLLAEPVTIAGNVEWAPGGSI